MTRPPRDRGGRKKGPEDIVAQSIDDLMRHAGFWISKMPQGTRPGIPRPTPGTPDRYFMHPTHRVALWVELKAPGGHLSSEQVEFLALHRNGGPGVPDAMVWDRWELCAAWLEDHGIMAWAAGKVRGKVTWPCPDGRFLVACDAPA